jgi:hypothetical protein
MDRCVGTDFDGGPLPALTVNAAINAACLTFYGAVTAVLLLVQSRRPGPSTTTTVS